MTEPDKSYTVTLTHEEIRALIEAIGEPLTPPEESARVKLIDARPAKVE